jgi:hypothetical protein
LALRVEAVALRVVGRAAVHGTVVLRRVYPHARAVKG